MQHRVHFSNVLQHGRTDEEVLMRRCAGTNTWMGEIMERAKYTSKRSSFGTYKAVLFSTDITEDFKYFPIFKGFFIYLISHWKNGVLSSSSWFDHLPSKLEISG
ncbi:hypothetical protein TNIN_403621 [Trichonephila inaurata madagascariensis]|uniref:Uncharacterized protein n=1 Tax=Trichonephila inaurata madagascariensis TaxID=2747483 RepID=A0A8X7CRQ7_9ARAC|nr:hypothetical protein TNIN_403621 [Trichonephila inaurata madagascariensis]